MAITSGYHPQKSAQTASSEWMKKYLNSKQPSTQPITKTLQQPSKQQPKTEQNLSYAEPKQQPKTEQNLSYAEPKQQTQTKQKNETEKQLITEDKSTKRFALRLTSKQRNQIKKLQKSWGLSTESAVIKKLIDDSKEEKNTSNLSHQIAELTEIKTELNRIGININQIAKKANQLNMTADELNAVMQYMQDVCDIIYGKGLKQ